MKTTKKLSLNEIQVESFVTNLSDNEKKTVDGAATYTVAVFIGGYLLTRYVCDPIMEEIEGALSFNGQVCESNNCGGGNGTIASDPANPFGGTCGGGYVNPENGMAY